MLLLAIQLLFAHAHASTESVLELLRQGQDAAALTEARQSVVQAPDDVEAHELLIDLLLNFGLGHQAEDAYASLASSNETALAWTLYGRAALTADLARANYEHALELDKDYARAWMGLAAVDRAQGGLARAEERYARSLALDPSLAEAWAGLGAVLVQTDRLDEALEVSIKATRAVPSDPEAWLACAALDDANARSWLESGVKSSPKEARLHHALAEALLQQGEIGSAARHLEQALELEPGLHQAEMDLAVVRELQAKRLDLPGHGALARARALSVEAPVAAMVTFDQLIEQYPDCYLVHLARGHLNAEQDLAPQAEKDLRRAVELAPASPDALGALGLLLLNEGNPQEARPLLDMAAAARPGDIALQVSAGMATLHVDGVAAGVKHLARTAEAHPYEVSPVMAMVTVLSQAGRPDAAYQVLDRSIAINPHPTLLLAHAAAAKDVGDNRAASRSLRELARITGEERYSRMADELGG
jgi:Tfp pilus assembly protein PilF